MEAKWATCSAFAAPPASSSTSPLLYLLLLLQFRCPLTKAQRHKAAAAATLPSDIIVKMSQICNHVTKQIWQRDILSLTRKAVSRYSLGPGSVNKLMGFSTWYEDNLIYMYISLNMLKESQFYFFSSLFVLSHCLLCHFFSFSVPLPNPYLVPLFPTLSLSLSPP